MEKKTSYHNPTVLVVDDEEVVRLLFQSLLEEEGLRPLLAVDARSAAEQIEKERPAVVLVDKNLPDRSGLELIAEQKPLHPQVEFIMITGYASLDSAVKAMELGAFSYLTKPFEDMEVVMDRIRSALDVCHLRRETEMLRDRLEDIQAEQPRSATPGSPRLLDQVLCTISLLESYREKRGQPPAAAAWAREVDTLDEAARLLREAVEAEQKG